MIETILILLLASTTIICGFGWWIAHNKCKGFESCYKQYFERE
jgi:hypothetical protein